MVVVVPLLYRLRVDCATCEFISEQKIRNIELVIPHHDRDGNHNAPGMRETGMEEVNNICSKKKKKERKRKDEQRFRKRERKGEVN